MTDRSKHGSRGPWSSWRRWATLLGALVLFAVVFDQLEERVDPGAKPSPDAFEDRDAPLEVIRPKVIRRGDAGIRLMVEDYRLTQNLHDEEKADRMIVCLKEGIATSTAFTEGEAGQPPASHGRRDREARAKQVWLALIEIHHACTTRLDLAPSDDRPRSM